MKPENQPIEFFRSTSSAKRMADDVPGPQALAQFQGAALAVVHDRYFIEQFANQVWEITEGGLLYR